MRMKKQNYILNLAACLLLFGLAACGVKPSSVEPPEGAQDSPFPRTYPDPSTDPQS